MLAPLTRAPVALRWRSLAKLTSPSSLRLLPSLLVSSNASPSPWCSLQPPLRPLHTSHSARQLATAYAQDGVEDSQSAAPARFSELAQRGLVNPVVIDTINNQLGFDTMTEVQRRTISQGLTGVDVLAQAKTGTGKTMAFLLPIIQRILQHDPFLAERNRRQRIRFNPEQLKAIIISPTRELAEQIAAEAKKVTQNTGIVVQSAVGGTQKREHLQKLHIGGCHILVGTPGRLKDILSDPSAGVSAPQLHSFVLDEADRLLDQGFLPEIQEIQDLLPPTAEGDRQTLMYSATVPREVVRLARSVMKPNLHYVRTVQEDENPTLPEVTQHVVMLPSLEHMIPAVLEVCARGIQETQDPATGRSAFKAIVYCNTKHETRLVSELFDAISMGTKSRSPDFVKSLGLENFPVLSISSDNTQSSRERTTQQFRRLSAAILVSSDVTARGMDFPNVSHVIQLGVPRDQEAYIHRLGRTARAGKTGEGWLLVPSAQQRTLRRDLSDMPLKRNSSLLSPQTEFEEGPNDMVDLSDPGKQYFVALQDAARAVPPNILSDAYSAMLSYYKQIWDGNQRTLIEQVNKVTKSNWGRAEPPMVSHDWANKRGLVGQNGLNLGQSSGYVKPNRYFDDGGRSGGRAYRSFGARRGDGDYADRLEKPLESEDRRNRSGYGRSGRGSFPPFPSRY